MVKLLLLDAKWEGEIKLIDELKEKLKNGKYKSVALFASIQFLNLDNLIKEVEDLGIKVNTTNAKRANKRIQVLGCDCYSNSFDDDIINDSDLILYVGDGMFHPKAILLSQVKSDNPKELILFNPIQGSVNELKRDTILNQLKRLRRNIKMYLNADKIGILVTLKPGQSHMAASIKLKEKLEKEGKRVYIFLDNTFNFFSLENYPFIDCWVNSACPRIGTDDIVNFDQPLINIRDALDPISSLEDLENKLN